MLMSSVVRRPRDHGDAGFSLMELIIAIAILSTIAVGVTGVVVQYLKVSTSTQTRMNESSDVQFVSTYWQDDVSKIGLRSTFVPTNSTNPAPADQSVWTAPADGGCSVSGSSPIVTFAWTSYPVDGSDESAAWNPTPQRVAYVAASSVNGNFLVKRVWCGSGSQPTIIVARNVISWTVACDGGACGAPLPSVVTLKLRVQDMSEVTNTGASSTGVDLTLTGERRQS